MFEGRRARLASNPPIIFHIGEHLDEQKSWSVPNKNAKHLYSGRPCGADQRGECRKDKMVLEIPSSYKNLDEVMANQPDLVEVVHTLKAVMCVKGS
jgi:hypothetical protein